MADVPQNETRTRILEVAEELFFRRGYSAVRLRDIASAVGIRHASLYYYVPGGKEQLFIEVMERNFRRHEAGLKQAIAEAGDDIRDQLHGVAGWLVSQPPLDLARMGEADMPRLGEAEAHRLMQIAFDSVRLPIVSALEKARAANRVRPMDLDMAAMALVGLIQSVHMVPSRFRSPDFDRSFARRMTDMLLDGLLK